MSRSRTFMAVAAIAAVVPLLLAGCGDDVGATALADTKAPAQLLRNEIAGRVPAKTIDKLGEADDASVACSADGTMRSWRSSQLMFIAPASAGRIETVLTGLVHSLQDQGWNATESDASSNIHEAKLKSASKTATILLTATAASDDEGNGATMEVAVTGPCVQTDGADSDAVKRLEGRD
jgi:hypothetical protein